MTSTWERRGVVICGAYGMGNAGDDAILESVTAGLRRIDEAMPVTVLARDAKKTAARFGVNAIHPLRILRWIRVMRGAELLISGGGTLLQDATSVRSLLYYLFVIRMAKCCGCAVQLYGCGAGPLRRAGSRKITAAVLNDCVDVITVRDSRSTELLREIGAVKPPVILTADPAFAGSFPSGPREKRFGAVLRSCPGAPEAEKETVRAIRSIRDACRLEPVLFCLSPEDRTVVRRAAEALADTACVYSTDAARIGRMSFVLSVRLHGLIFAVRAGVPAAGISYDPKVSAFCEEAGIPCVEANEADENAMLSMADRAVHTDAERLFETAARLRQRERQNAETAARLLRERRKGSREEDHSGPDDHRL